MLTTKTEPSQFVWYELHSRDVTSAKAFYTGVLGWNAQDSGMPDRRYILVHVGATPVGGLLQKPASTFPLGIGSYWVGYIGVSDVAAYAKRVQEAGGTVHRGRKTYPMLEGSPW